MKKILIIGIGGSAIKIAEAFKRKNINDYEYSYLGIDSDIDFLATVDSIPTLSLSDNINVGQAVDYIGYDTISDWFPLEDDYKKFFYRSLNLRNGSNGWRMKGLLSLEYSLNQDDKKQKLLSAIDDLFLDEIDERKIYLISSICGGTGSAILLPLSLYLKKYIKHKFSKNIEIYSILACPDIYVNAIPKEVVPKLYANSYATIQELNLVESVIDKGNSWFLDSVFFKIGNDKSKGIGQLFNTQNNIPESAPIDKIFIFTKKPGITTINQQEESIANDLCFIDYVGCEKSKITYFCSSEVAFDYNSILDYVACRKVVDEINKEWLFLFNSFSGEKVRDETVNCNDVEAEFANDFVEYYKKNFRVSQYEQNLALGRLDQNETAFGDDTCVAFEAEYIDKYFIELIRYFESKLDIEDDEEYKKILQQPTIKNKKLFESKAVKTGKKEEVKKYAKNLYEYLLSYYKKRVKYVNSLKGELYDLFHDENNELSLLNKVYKRNGKFVHPVTTFYLLCQMYSLLEKRLKQYSRKKGEFLDESAIDLPKSIYNSIDQRNINSVYLSLGDKRLKILAESDVKKFSSKLIKDIPLIKDDFEELRVAIDNLLTKELLVLLNETVKEDYKKYKRLFSFVRASVNELDEELRLSKENKTVDTSLQMNVGTSVEIKERVFDLYKSSKSEIFNDDAISGEMVYKLIDTKDISELLNVLSQENKKEIEKSFIFGDLKNRDIFSILHNKDIFDKNYQETSSNPEFNKALNYVNTHILLDDSEGKINKNDGTIIISPKSMQFIASLEQEDLEEKKTVENYLFKHGNYDKGVIVSDKVSSNKIILIKQIQNIDFSNVAMINDNFDDATCYMYCNRAFEVCEKQNSEMWNPYLDKNAKEIFYPFLSKDKNEKYAEDSVKAFLGALFIGDVTVSEENGEKFYSDINGDPMIFMGNKILPKDNFSLLKYFFQNKIAHIKYCKIFDEIVKKDGLKVCQIDVSKDSITKFISSFVNCDFLQFIMRDIFKNMKVREMHQSIIDFVEDISEVNVKYANIICETVKTINNQIINSKVDFVKNDCNIKEEVKNRIVETYKQYKHNKDTDFARAELLIGKLI